MLQTCHVQFNPSFVTVLGNNQHMRQGFQNAKNKYNFAQNPCQNLPKSVTYYWPKRDFRNFMIKFNDTILICDFRICFVCGNTDIFFVSNRITSKCPNHFRVWGTFLEISVVICQKIWLELKLPKVTY